MEKREKRLRRHVEKKIVFFYHAHYSSFRRITDQLAKKRRKRKSGAKDFVNAESFEVHDKICRVFASECSELAQKYADQGLEKLGLQYVKFC